MRRRLLRLVAVAVVVPAAGWVAEEMARRMESDNGPNLVSGALHSAAGFAQRSSRGPFGR